MLIYHMILYESIRPEVFWRKDVLKICSKFTGEHPSRSVISIKLHTLTWVFSCKFAAYFQNTFSKTTSGRMLLHYSYYFIMQESWANRVKLNFIFIQRSYIIGVKQTLTESRFQYCTPRDRYFVKKLLNMCKVSTKENRISYLLLSYWIWFTKILT